MKVPTETVTDWWTGVTAEAPSANGHEENDKVRTRLAEADGKVAGLFGAEELSTTAEFTNASSHPIIQITSRRPASGFKHRVQLDVFHAMRRYVPTLDTAIENRRDIEGDIRIEADDDGLQQELRDFSRSVPVGRVEGAPQTGLNTYLNLVAGAADEYGLSVGEVVLDGDGRTVERLVVPSSRTLSLRDPDNNGLYGIYQTQSRDFQGRGPGPVRIDDNPRVQSLTFRPSADRPWPKPLAWALVQSSEVMLRMYESVANGWWRFGDPSMLVTEEYPEGANPDTVQVDGTDIPQSLMLLRATMQEVFKDRKSGKVSDAYHSVVGAEVDTEVIGNVDATLMRWFAQHNNVFAGQIIGQAQTPVWMHPEVELSGEGLNSDRSNNQTVMAAVSARKRNVRKRQLFREVLNTKLIAEGSSNFVGEYRLVTDEAAIIDDKEQAEADLTRAEANQIHAQVANVLYESDGSRRIDEGEAEDYLERHKVYPNEL